MKRLLSSCFAALTLGIPVAQAQTVTSATITIDATDRKPISRFIYGANFPKWEEIGLPFTLARQGGNRMSAYNWENNASNAGSDWHHQNDSLMSNSNEPGLVGRQFLEETRRHKATAILTVPMTGYVAADKKGDGDVNQTPNYLETRFKKSLPRKSGPLVYPPNPNDAFVYQDEYVAYIEKIKGPDMNVWYALDNEPDIWSGTHARIVPKTPTYAEFIARSIDYASAIKAVAPNALISGPVSYGWQGFRRFQNASDANNRDFLDVYLSAMADAERKSGKRLLDLLDIHWYPEARGGGVRITEESQNPATAVARIQAPRSLWDPTYVEDSWIVQSLGGKSIALIPGLQQQIATHYPGTKLAITEYNYGGKNDISGAIAQADVLGIFGRYGVFAACNWGISPGDTAEIAGFRAFLNFDGQGAQFGDLGLGVQGETPSEDSVYAALDSKNKDRLTVVVINKTESVLPIQLLLKGFLPKEASAYRVTAKSLTQSRPVSVTVKGSKVTLAALPLSINTVIVTR
jgi:hypothetical protein